MIKNDLLMTEQGCRFDTGTGTIQWVKMVDALENNYCLPPWTLNVWILYRVYLKLSSLGTIFQMALGRKLSHARDVPGLFMSNLSCLSVFNNTRYLKGCHEISENTTSPKNRKLTFRPRRDPGASRTKCYEWFCDTFEIIPTVHIIEKQLSVMWYRYVFI